jgi:hypothetical protein
MSIQSLSRPSPLRAALVAPPPSLDAAASPPAADLSPRPSAEATPAPRLRDGAGRLGDARLQGQLLRSQLEHRLAPAERVALTPLPTTRRAELGPPLFRAELDPAAEDRPFFSENRVPMRSMLINAATINRDVLQPSYIAQAALRAQPELQLLVPTQARFDDRDDPRFRAERDRIAGQLGVPADRVVPVRADMAAWPQDELLAGRAGLVKPQSSQLTTDAFRYGSAPGADHWTMARRTRFGASDLASELGLPLNSSAGIARGGDTHVVQRPDGGQAAYFSRETIEFAADARGIDIRSDAGYLRGIATVMTELHREGIPLDRIAPLGRGDKTWGEVLDTLSPEERRGLDPDVLKQMETMRELSFPRQAWAYHTDVMAWTPDGRTMFVNEDQERRDPELRRQLEHFGYEVETLPAFSTRGPPGETIQDLDTRGARLSYMNAVMGVRPDGVQVMLMPTEAVDPSRLTARDRRAMDTIQRRFPELQIVPIGGASAVTGHGDFASGARLDRDWGAHCMSNVLPYLVTPR